MREGDVIGHEFLGEIVEVGPAVRLHRPGDRVVVCSVIACGGCWYCEHGLAVCAGRRRGGVGLCAVGQMAARRR